MGVCGNLLEIDVISQFHVLGVNAYIFQATSWIWDANIDFTVKAAETTESRVN